MPHWILRNQIPRNKKSFVHSDVPDIISTLLVSRGIHSKQDAKSFFDSQKDWAPSQTSYYSIDLAIETILSAIKKNQKIFIHGDYDVDGVCATAILWDYLYHALGADVTPFIPSRFDEGYGMSDETLSTIKKAGGQLVITVDCGIRDVDLVKKWNKKGLAFIITDHHEFVKDKKDKIVLPPAEAVIHPRHPKNTKQFGEICGSAVSWNLICALAIKTKKGNSRKYLPLVALATVCDIMPLIKDNRWYVKEGLALIQENQMNIGLGALINQANLSFSKISAYHLGFVIGPRINASGRLESAMDALRLLTTKNNTFAYSIAQKLDSLNMQRQDITKQIVEEALAYISENETDKKLFFIHGNDWPEGVVGLVAGKITEQFHRPVLISSNATEEGFIKGSARSTSAFNIIDAISKQSDLLQKFGGHAQAAGFLLHKKNLQKFKEALQNEAEELLQDVDLEKVLEYDAEISPNDITNELLDWLSHFEPNGFGNPTPTFAMYNIPVNSIQFIGEGKHVRFKVPSSNDTIQSIGFNMSELFQDIQDNDTIDILFSLQWNEWNGRKDKQIVLKDVKTKNDKTKKSVRK